jgi:hypothetical protein
MTSASKAAACADAGASIRMTFEYPYLDKVNHLVFLQDTTPIEKYPEIVDNILNKQFLEFVERKNK